VIPSDCVRVPSRASDDLALPSCSSHPASRGLPAEGEPDDECHSNDGQNDGLTHERSMQDPDLRPSRRAGCAALIQCCWAHGPSWMRPPRSSTVLGPGNDLTVACH
jgi:hypothetical protein